MRHFIIFLLILLCGLPPALAQESGLPVERIGADFGSVAGYRYLRVISDDAPVLDAPDGTERYRFFGGFDFVTPRSQDGEWIEINAGEWLHESHVREVYPSQFSGVLVHAEPGVAWGWVLVGHYSSSEPGGPEVTQPDYWVDRYTVATLHQTLAADGWNWYDVGGGRWVKQTLVSKVNRAGNPGFSGRWVAVDLYEQNLTAYEGNTMVFATLVSSGLPGNDTNPGTFSVYARGINVPMNGRENGFGDYRLENVPYTMYFDDLISLHGTYWHNSFGYRRSRGCVNLSISDAHWLYEWLGDGSQVYVYYSQSY
jgi:hypothetical protein